MWRRRTATATIEIEVAVWFGSVTFVVLCWIYNKPHPSLPLFSFNFQLSFGKYKVNPLIRMNHRCVYIRIVHERERESERERTKRTTKFQCIAICSSHSICHIRIYTYFQLVSCPFRLRLVILSFHFVGKQLLVFFVSCVFLGFHFVRFGLVRGGYIQFFFSRFLSHFEDGSWIVV